MATYHLPLLRRQEIAEGTMAFWFDTRNTDFRFTAGQNADFTIENPPETDAEGNMRTFSLASSPLETDALMIATRMRPTAFKNSLRAMALGTKVKVEGPLGDMMLHEDISKPAILFAGGIGITPFHSMITWATATKAPYDLTLLYSNRNPESTAFLNDLVSAAKKNPRFTLAPTVTELPTTPWPYEQGRIDGEFVTRHVPNLTATICYLAGPDAFVTAMRTQLIELGVSRDAIRTESFSGY